MGPEYAALLLAGAGTAASMYGQRQQAKERRAIVNRQLDASSQATDKANELIQKEGENYAPDKRAEAMQQAEDAAFTRAQQDLATTNAGIIDTAGGAGNTSDAFKQSREAVEAGESARMSAIARELAKVRAPGQLMTQEGLRRANLAGELNNRASTIRNLSGAAGLDAEAVGEPWYGQLGKVAQSIGTAYAGSKIGNPGTNYSLPGGGAQLGLNGQTPAWLNASGARIRFGG